MAPAAAAVAGEARGGREAGNGGKRSGRKGRRHSAYLRRLSCFKPPAAGGDGDGDLDKGVDEEGKRRIPTHLVVMVNGIIGRFGTTASINLLSAGLAIIQDSELDSYGVMFEWGPRDYRRVGPVWKHRGPAVFGSRRSAANWRFSAKQFVKKYPEDVIVHCSESNYSTLTFDGVDVMGERLAKEVISAVARRPELQKISFIGHSLGGLIARYAIGILYGKDAPRNPPEENGGCETYTSGAQCMEEKLKGKIAGLEPMNFITFATPHLGSSLHKQIPILRGSFALEKMAYHISWIIGRTGKHLFLKDCDEGKPPLLLRMVNDCGDLKFMSALQSFKRRVAYSNAHYDFIVGWKTSSIRHQDELPKRQSFTKNGNYPHVVYVEKPKTAIMQQEDFSETMISQPKSSSEMEEAMIKGLTRVPWERVDISFQKSIQKIFAHCTIQVNTYLINSDGADVIFHMIDNLHL